MDTQAKSALSTEKAKALQAALAQIEKQFGKGSIMRLGEGEVAEDIQVVSTGSLGLDVALGVGGLHTVLAVNARLHLRTVAVAAIAFTVLRRRCLARRAESIEMKLLLMCAFLRPSSAATTAAVPARPPVHRSPGCPSG